MIGQKPSLRLQTDALKRVVAILFYGRSGSVFLGSLLDGHPKTVSTPGTYLTGFYEFWKEHGHLPARELIDVFVDYYAVLFDARNKSKSPITGPNAGEELGFTRMGPDRQKHLEIDREIFVNSLRDIITEEVRVPRRLFFQALHIAYNEALRRLTDPEPIIVFPLHTPNRFRAKELVKDFPDTVFLQVIRRPIQTLGSHFVHNVRKGMLDMYLAEDMLAGVLFGGIPVVSGYGLLSRAVKLEDLHSNPRQTMQKICDWLGLPWNDILLKSTFNGIQWWNVIDSPQISGFSKVTVSKKHREYISLFDEFRLNVLFVPKYKAWAYPFPRWYCSIFIRLIALPLLLFPLRMELLWWRRSPSKWSFRDIHAALLAIIRVRRILFRAWKMIFKLQREEIELI